MLIERRRLERSTKHDDVVDRNGVARVRRQGNSFGWWIWLKPRADKQWTAYGAFFVRLSRGEYVD